LNKEQEGHILDNQNLIMKIRFDKGPWIDASKFKSPIKAAIALSDPTRHKIFEWMKHPPKFKPKEYDL